MSTQWYAAGQDALWSNVTNLNNDVIHAAEGCAGYFAIFSSKQAGTLYPDVSITRNPHRTPLGRAPEGGGDMMAIKTRGRSDIPGAIGIGLITLGFFIPPMFTLTLLAGLTLCIYAAIMGLREKRTPARPDSKG